MDVIGGGVLVAVAAALWIAYLLPNWLRRRQYLATERNAVRLQQTLRILAETAETPEAVVVEATAREVATQQRILHEHEAAARLAAEAAEQIAIAERREAEEVADAARARAEAATAARAPATEPIELPAGSSDATGRAARLALRRKRAVCSLTAFAALLTVVGGLVAAAFGASLLVAGVAGVVFLAAFGGLLALARVQPPRQASVVAQPMPAAPEFEPIELVDTAAEPAGWTPQPLPRPLHLSRGTIAATAMASIEAAAELKRAEAEAAVARRAEQLAPAVPSISPAASASAPEPRRTDRPPAASPYASMGIVDDARPGFEDLDAVLRRRRAAG